MQPRNLHSFPTRRSSDLIFLAETSIRAALYASREWAGGETARALRYAFKDLRSYLTSEDVGREHYARQEDVRIDLLTREGRSEEHTSELQSHSDLVCRLL